MTTSHRQPTSLLARAGLLGVALLLAGAGAAQAQPTPTPTSTDTTVAEPAAPPAADTIDADALRREYLALRDELFASRARVAAVASQLFSTKLSLRLAWTTGRYQGVSQAIIRLDGATVYQDSAGGIAADDAIRFEGYVAPGTHVITYALEAAAKDDDTFTSTTETSVTVVAVAGKDLVVAAKARDDGDIGYAWSRGEHGGYHVVLAVDVRTQARPAKTARAATPDPRRGTRGPAPAEEARCGRRAALTWSRCWPRCWRPRSPR